MISQLVPYFLMVATPALVLGAQLCDIDVDAGTLIPVVDARFKQNGPTPPPVVKFAGFHYPGDPP
jgi:hypothetical protein